MPQPGASAPLPAGSAEVNPLLFAFFCPHCVLSGLFALGATGVVTLPSLFGVSPEMWLAPAMILGTFLGWLAWGQWSKRQRCAQGACKPRTGPSPERM